MSPEGKNRNIAPYAVWGNISVKNLLVEQRDWQRSQNRAEAIALGFFSNQFNESGNPQQIVTELQMLDFQTLPGLAPQITNRSLILTKHFTGALVYDKLSTIKQSFSYVHRFEKSETIILFTLEKSSLSSFIDTCCHLFIHIFIDSIRFIWSRPGHQRAQQT